MTKSLNSSEEAKQLQETSKNMLEALRQCIDIMKDSQLTDQVCICVKEIVREREGERERKRENGSVGMCRIQMIVHVKVFLVLANCWCSLTLASKDSVSDSSTISEPWRAN